MVGEVVSADVEDRDTPTFAYVRDPEENVIGLGKTVWDVGEAEVGSLLLIDSRSVSLRVVHT